MGDLKHPGLIVAKGILFLLAGVLAATALLLLHPEWRTAALLAVAVWCFARFYYFAFYVIQHYVDPAYRFAGLSSFVVYLFKRRSGDRRSVEPE